VATNKKIAADKKSTKRVEKPSTKDVKKKSTKSAGKGSSKIVEVEKSKKDVGKKSGKEKQSLIYEVVDNQKQLKSRKRTQKECEREER
jgi:hypothetical protein